MSEVVDFSPEERAFLCHPRAEDALAAAGVVLEDLRPRALESFEEPKEMRAATFEQRRVYQWRLVRQELAKLEQRAEAAKRKAAAATTSEMRQHDPRPTAIQPPEYYTEARKQLAQLPQEPPAGAGGRVESVEAAAQRAHELALRQMVQRETRALERELRAEKQRERLEDRQRAASESRLKVLSEKQRQRAASRESREFLSDVRAERRELEARAARPASARPASARAASTPPGQSAGGPSDGPSEARGGGGGTTARSARGGGGEASLAEVVRARAEAARQRRAESIAQKMASKEKSTARRKEEAEAERAMRRLYAEQMRLRHEERLAGVQLAALEQTMRQQRELEERQHKAERERAAMRAAVGKVAASSGGGGGEVGDGGGEAGRQADRQADLASKVAERAAHAQQRLAEAARQAEEKAAMRDARAAEYRRKAEEQRQQERRALQIRNHEQSLRRQQKRESKLVQEELQRARAQTAAELATRRCEEQQERMRREREQKRLAHEVREEAHRQNAERIQRAIAYRTAQTEASIQNKTLRYEQRRQTMEETQHLRQAYAVARAKQQASIHTKIRGAGGSSRLEREAYRAAAEVAPSAAVGEANVLPSASTQPLQGGGGAHLRAPRPAQESHSSVTEAFGADRRSRGEPAPSGGGDGALSRGVAAGVGAAGRDAKPQSAAEREDARTRAAFAAIEKLRSEQNAELRAAVEAEQVAEAGRVALLTQTSEGPDRVRLQKLLKLERDRADAELRGLTAEHELALAQRFKKLGVTR